MGILAAGCGEADELQYQITDRVVEYHNYGTSLECAGIWTDPSQGPRVCHWTCAVFGAELARVDVHFSISTAGEFVEGKTDAGACSF